MANELVLEVEGLEELQKALAQFPAEWQKGAESAMRLGLIVLESAAKEKAPHDMGALAGSIGSQIVGGMGSEIIGKVGSRGLSYAPYALEYGRLPGKMPPPDIIEEWAGRHGMAGMGFVIARAIGARGIKAPQVLTKVLKEKSQQVVRLIEQGIEKVLRSLKL